MHVGESVTYDGNKIFWYFWNEVKKPKGVVQIMHGMSEHAFRYDDFAKFLNENGYYVIADDHRAHGKTAEVVDRVGKYTEGQVFYDTVKDMTFSSNVMQEHFPDLPLFVFGHSYGSFLLQKYIQDYHKYAGAIFSGSSYMKNFVNSSAKKIAKITMKFKGADAPANFIEKNSFYKYSKKAKGSWLTTDKAQAKLYRDDPFCGVPFSAKFYYDMFDAVLKLYRPEGLAQIDKNKPILIMSGKEDAIGGYGKDVLKLYKTYINCDIKDVKLKLYEGARHELLFEREEIKKQAYVDILAFLEKHTNTEAK